MQRKDRSVTRHALGLAATVLVVVQSACTTVASPPPAAAIRQGIGVVAVAPAQYVPESNFATFAKGTGAGAAKGAAIEGGTAAAGTAIVAAVAAPIAIPVVVFAGAVASAAMAIHGTFAGARLAVPTVDAAQVESVISDAVARLDAQNAVATRLASIAKDEPWIRLAPAPSQGPMSAKARPDYAELRITGAGAVLEIAVQEIKFGDCAAWDIAMLAGGCSTEPERGLLSLFLSAQLRLVRVSDGTELLVRQFKYKSPRRDLARWVANDGELMAKEFEQAYQELAERAHDEVFLATPLKLPAPSNYGKWPSARNTFYGICWLAPIQPSSGLIIWSKPADTTPAVVSGYTVIDSIRPTLRWSSFPRDLDRRELNPATLQGIGDVTYDLKIWETEEGERSRLVYTRTGLPNPEHAMEESLAPDSRYFWSVRARFSSDGQPMATRWAHSSGGSCFANDLKDRQYHRFATPK